MDVERKPMNNRAVSNSFFYTKFLRTNFRFVWTVEQCEALIGLNNIPLSIRSSPIHSFSLRRLFLLLAHSVACCFTVSHVFVVVFFRQQDQITASQLVERHLRKLDLSELRYQTRNCGSSCSYDPELGLSSIQNLPNYS